MYTNAEQLIREKIEKLCQRFCEACESQQVLRLDAAYMALTMDIITQYSFGNNDDYLSVPDFKLEWKETVIKGSASGAFIRQFPWAFAIMKSIPLAVLSVIARDASLLVRWQQMVRKQVDSILENSRVGQKATGTIFQALLDSDLAAEEKSADRLQDEAQTLVGAGSETTAKVLSIISFYLFRNREMLEKLRQELSTIDLKGSDSGKYTLSELEQLPYLVSAASHLSRRRPELRLILLYRMP